MTPGGDLNLDHVMRRNGILPKPPIMRIGAGLFNPSHLSINYCVNPFAPCMALSVCHVVHGKSRIAEHFTAIPQPNLTCSSHFES